MGCRPLIKKTASLFVTLYLVDDSPVLLASVRLIFVHSELLYARSCILTSEKTPHATFGGRLPSGKHRVDSGGGCVAHRRQDVRIAVDGYGNRGVTQKFLDEFRMRALR